MIIPKRRSDPWRETSPLESQKTLGRIDVAPEAIAMVAGIAAECFGVVGMSSRSFQDGIAELLLGKENLTKGIEVRIDDNRVIVGCT